MKMTKEIWLNRINLTLAMAKADGKHGVEVCVTPRTRDEMDELGVLDALPSSVVVTVMGELRGIKVTGMIIDELSRQANAAAAWPFPAALPGYQYFNWNRKYPGEPKNSLDEGTRAVNPLPSPEEIKQAWKDHAAKVDEKALDRLIDMPAPREAASSTCKPDDSATVSLYRRSFDAVYEVLVSMCHGHLDADAKYVKTITITVIE